MATFNEVKSCLQSNGVEEMDLDDLVHECKSSEASSINNGGFDEQLTYLIQSLGPGELMARLSIDGDEIDKVIGA